MNIHSTVYTVSTSAMKHDMGGGGHSSINSMEKIVSTGLFGFSILIYY